MRKSFIALIITALAISPLTGQDGIGDKLGALVKNNAQEYLAPLPTAMGLAMNSATFQRAKPHKILGFDATFSLGAVVAPESAGEFQFIIEDFTQTLPAIDGTTYDVTFDADLLYPGDRTAQTLFGEQESATFVVDDSYANNAIINRLTAAGLSSTVISAAAPTIAQAVSLLPDIVAPGGLGGGGWPVLVPQLSLGLPMGLELSFRGGLDLDVPDFGNISFGGFGGKIGINQFIPTIPLVFPALAVGYYSTNFSIDTDVAKLEANNSILNLQISKSIPFITVFAGLGFESSNLDVTYTFTDPNGILEPQELKFSKAGENKVRTTVGGRLKLFLFTFHGAYISSGDYSGFYGGLGLTFR